MFIYECQPCADSVGFDTIMHIASILSKGRDIPVPREKGRGILPLDYPREGIFRFFKIQGKGYAAFRRYSPYGLHASYGGGAKSGFEPKFWLLSL